MRRERHKDAQQEPERVHRLPSGCDEKEHDAGKNAHASRGESRQVHRASEGRDHRTNNSEDATGSEHHADEQAGPLAGSCVETDAVADAACGARQERKAHRVRESEQQGQDQDRDGECSKNPSACGRSARIAVDVSGLMHESRVDRRPHPRCRSAATRLCGGRARHCAEEPTDTSARRPTRPGALPSRLL